MLLFLRICIHISIQVFEREAKTQQGGRIIPPPHKYSSLLLVFQLCPAVSISFRLSVIYCYYADLHCSLLICSLTRHRHIVWQCDMGIHVECLFLHGTAWLYVLHIVACCPTFTRHDQHFTDTNVPTHEVHCLCTI